MEGKFAGKVAIVTGSSKGIGAAIAKRLAKEGASVVINYHSSKEGADRVVNEIVRNDGKAVAIQADLRKEIDIKRLFDEASDIYGPIDVLVNNAGIYEFSPLDGITVEHFHKQIDLNVLGVLLAAREAVRHFNKKGGSIVNISSTISSLTPPETVVYSATKAAVDAITKVLAKELAIKKIRVNSVNPGTTDTEGLNASGLNESGYREWIEQNSPIPRVGTVDEIAAAASFLASDEASYITGENLFVAGGLQ